MATTPRWALPYPLGSDAPDVPHWMQALAVALDDHAKDDQGPLGQRPVSTLQSPGKSGRYYYATDTQQLFRDTGFSWVEIPIGGNLVRNNDPRLTNARTPTAHAASHAAGGADRLYASGATHILTGGTGWAEATITHNLGVTPTWVGVSISANVTASTVTAEVSNKNPVTAYIRFPTGVGGHSMWIEWVALR